MQKGFGKGVPSTAKEPPAWRPRVRDKHCTHLYCIVLSDCTDLQQDPELVSQDYQRTWTESGIEHESDRDKA